jgi:hypothetical protein
VEEALPALRRALPEAEFVAEIVETIGDRDLKTSLTDERVPTDFFTRELDQAQLSGEIDLVIHSAKDLPDPMPEDLVVAAMLPARDTRDVLILRPDESVDDVRVIGTSSPVREARMRERFPDAVCKPIRGGIGRRIVGWLVCGLAMGAAFMTKNTALVLIVLPLLAMILVGPYRRLANTLGMVLALIIGLLAAAPWYIYVIQSAEALGIADPVGQLFRDWPMVSPANVMQDQRQPTYYYLLGLPLVFPWVIWLLGGLFQPWARGRGERRRQLLLGWVWLVVGLVALSIPGAKQERYLIPLLPAVGVLAAQLWAYHIRLADDGLPDPGVNLLRIPHWAMLGVASLGVPGYMLLQAPIAQIVNQNFADGEPLLADAELPGLHPAAIGGFGAVLLGLVILGAWWHWRWKPRPAFAASAAWAILFLTVIQYSYSQSYHAINPYRDDARRIDRMVGKHPLLWLKTGDRNEQPNEEFLFYAQRVVPPVVPEQLDELQEEHAVVFVMCRRDPDHARTLREAGYAPVAEFDDGRFGGRKLYRAMRLPRAAGQP